MRFLLVLALVLVGFTGLGNSTAKAALICPTTSSTNSDCGFIITIGPGNAITGSAVAGANPYDGSDDALVGVINNSGGIFTGAITFSGSGNGGGLFAFDGDGICTYVSASYCTTAPTGYEGPLNTFTNINPAGTTGTVDFSTLGGIADGATTFFSLEGSPASIIAGGGLGGIPGGTTTPEPASLGVLMAGLAGVWTMRRKSRK